MRHRKGIDLLAALPPAKYYEYRRESDSDEKISGMREWESLGAKCSGCGHIAWLDQRAVIRRYGDMHLRDLSARFVCRCGNAKGNRLLVGNFGRD